MDYGQVLGIRSLTSTAEALKFPEFWLQDQVPTNPIDGDLAEWDILTPSRVLVNNFTQRDGNAKPTEYEAIGHKTANCLHSFHFGLVKPGNLQNLRQPGTDKERNARAFVARLQRSMKRLHGALVDEWMLWETLKGTLTVAFQSVNVAIDYEIPGTHKPDVSTGGTNQPWSTTSTDILGHLETWLDLIAQDSGRKGLYMVFNRTVAPYLYKNDLIKTYLASTNVGTQIVQEGRLAKVFGLTLLQNDTAYVNSSGTVTKFVPDNYVLIFPEPSEDWIEMLVGEVAAPTEDGKDFQFVREAWYTEVSKDPVGLRLFYHKARVPALKVPAACIYGKVA